MLILFTIAIFFGAGLLFLVQPMIAKQLLPMLGGSPAVWNTCMVFFQVALLLGYVYAHVLTKLRSQRTQMLVHLVVMAAAAATLPIGLGEGAGPGPDDSPNGWLLVSLATSVGGPFFVLASASPLIQKWFGATDHRWADDPYFLYAASNAGSMLALLAYPLLLEPELTLTEQTTTWSWAFGGFALLALACVGVANKSGTQKATKENPIGAEAVRWSARVRWILLAFVPSSLMLGVTQHITTDVATTPILWVGPLAIYLVTFILAFAGWGRPIVMLSRFLFPIAIVVVGTLMVAELRKPIWPQVWAHLAGLLIIGTAIHGRLAADRPPAAKLTEFYLLMSIGGALGGTFNALVAPLVFDRVAEYPLTLVLACLLFVPLRLPYHDNRALWHKIVVPVVALAIVASLAFWRWKLVNWFGAREEILGFDGASILSGLIPALGCLVFMLNEHAFALGVLALLAMPHVEPHEGILHTERTFFGVHRVTTEEDSGEPKLGNWHNLSHGSTGHGSQFRPFDPSKPWAKTPTRYYTRSGPAGDLMQLLGIRKGQKSIALVGLGAGTLAAYGRPGWHITYYEIDPAVRRIASNPALFTYLADSQAKIDFQMGDARLRLQANSAVYDAIFLDAFSSDAIPVHLITKEAVELYLAHLREDGVLVFHITNLHLDLEPVLANIAQDLGLAAAIRRDYDTEEYKGQDKDISVWVGLARRREILDPIPNHKSWRWLKADPSRRTWTDDYSNVLGVRR